MLTFIIIIDDKKKKINADGCRLMYELNRGRLIAMQKEGFAYVCERIATMSKNSFIEKKRFDTWITGLSAAKLIKDDNS